MAQPTFFEQPSSSTLADIAALTKAQLADPARAGQQVRGLASLDEAGPMHLTFFDNLKYADQLAATKAGACLVSPRFEARVPAHVAVLRAAHPFRDFVKIARELHGDALRPQTWFGVEGIAPSAIIDPTAHLEDGVVVDADRQVLAAVVGGLLQNAFKFTGPRTTVTLRVGASAERVLIEILDECSGLPDGNVNELFRPFEELDAEAGAGLGIAFSRWGIEANDGRIYARNLPDQGCVFTVDLPRRSAPAAMQA